MRGIIIASVSFKPCTSEQHVRSLPGEARAENRGKREPMMRRVKAVGQEEEEEVKLQKGSDEKRVEMGAKCQN